MKEWIDGNINKPLKVKDVAKISGYSKWHLQREFMKYTNKTLCQYVLDRKLYFAAKDLVSGYEPILSISLRYGFDSHQSFTRVFTRRYKTPPSVYRRNNYLMHRCYPGIIVDNDNADSIVHKI
ncbi:helix-turn-helix domain-containing protein [Pantoea cypripedii]|uniref:helix-turn-helix domain-containing protein n=1 Tax=Pantoea cypripedii TaxID=55209 RepID=UPI000A10D47C|nr:helix-turn-helix domain-containing protein [Pantoea cypripedii]